MIRLIVSEQVKMLMENAPCLKKSTTKVGDSKNVLGKKVKILKIHLTPDSGDNIVSFKGQSESGKAIEFRYDDEIDDYKIFQKK